MIETRKFPRLLKLVLCWVIAVHSVVACHPEVACARPQQEPQEKKVLTIDDYGRWNRIDSASISPDGKWVTYAYAPNEGDKTFFVKQIESKDKPMEVPMGSSPVFSNDSKWLAYVVSPSEKEAAKLRKSGKPALNTIHLMNLETKKTTQFEGAVRVTFPKESSGFAAISMAKPSGQKSSDSSGGSDLLVVDLKTMAVRNIGNVGTFSFNKSGEILAYTIDAANQSGNGLYLLELGTGVLRPLDTSGHRYRQLTWNEEGNIWRF